MKQKTKNIVESYSKDVNEDFPHKDKKNNDLSSKAILVTDTKEEDKKNLDPTHFGDWQVGCRTIDF